MTQQGSASARAAGCAALLIVLPVAMLVGAACAAVLVARIALDLLAPADRRP